MTGTNYRLPLGSVDPACQDHTPFAVITNMPVKSLITTPVEGFACPAGNTLDVRGFAWSGHVPVSSMEISGNGGRTWVRTELEPAVDRFAWRRFRATLKPTRRGAMTIIARATDASGRSQPLDNAPWNPRGYCNNIVHRVVGEITPAD